MTIFWLFTAGIATLVAFQVFTLARLFWLRRAGQYPPAGQASMADVERLLRDGLPIWAIRCYREIHGCSLREAKAAVRDLEVRS
ncbi:hypothetical protein EZJ19_11050 [Parasulfuritortus cantonensis]|uniref:Ribosomal protein L7/L12 C-terminal domain-containing protein n=1 Tax=Parasulfuritortus cantonensis TaxID=2528202 RepID=A0A4R1B5I7_9PROT|nr:hypothetical protein [Parasulfuritortus cantonensis]TCJ12770.1 hypothetical protein EZJ19_11050 [Parasulfuritortus cantonensis]